MSEANEPAPPAPLSILKQHIMRLTGIVSLSSFVFVAACSKGASSDAPKTAYELAMERLRRKDEQDGIVTGPLSEQQKAEIAEARQFAEARLAELKILHQSKVAAIFDPSILEPLEMEYRGDVQRVVDTRERKIAAIRERS